MENKIILIGGAPGVGKSTLAQKLLEKEQLPWVSTDSLHKTMREFVSKEKYPALWEFHGIVEEYVGKHTPQDIFDGHHGQSLAVWEAVRAWINKTRHPASYIIEGTAVIPEMVKRDFGDNAIIRPIFLYDSSRENIFNVIRTRGVWVGAPQYPDEFNQKYADWIVIFNEWLKGECAKYGYPLIEVGDRATLLDRCLEYIK